VVLAGGREGEKGKEEGVILLIIHDSEMDAREKGNRSVGTGGRRRKGKGEKGFKHFPTSSSLSHFRLE